MDEEYDHAYESQNPKLWVRFAKTAAERKRIRSFCKLVRISRTRGQRDALIVDINLRRLVTSLVVCGVLTYALVVCGLYAWRTTIPHNQIEFVDVLIPIWSRLSDKEGKTRIAQGMAAYRTGDRRTALFKLRAGLSRYPQDMAARYTLAEIYCTYGLLDRAAAVLQQGIPWGYPGKASIELMIYIAQFQPDFQLIVSAAERLLAFPEIQQEKALQRLIYQAWIRALIATDRYAELYRVCHALNHTEDAVMQAYDGEILALIQLGRKDEVVSLLESVPARVRQRSDYHVLALSAYLRLGRNTDALQSLRRLERAHPLDYIARAKAVVAFLSQGDEQTGVRALDSYVQRFKFNDTALAKIAELLTDLPASKYVKRCLGVAIELNSVNTELIRFLYVQSLVKEAEWAAAVVAQREWSSNVSDSYESVHLRDWMDALLAAVLDADAVNLNRLLLQLEGHTYPPEVYLESAIAMQRTGHLQPAVEILSLALQYYPYNRAFTTLSADLDPHVNSVQIEREQALQGILDALAQQRAGTVENELEERENRSRQ